MPQTLLYDWYLLSLLCEGKNTQALDLRKGAHEKVLHLNDKYAGCLLISEPTMRCITGGSGTVMLPIEICTYTWEKIGNYGDEGNFYLAVEDIDVHFQLGRCVYLATSADSSLRHNLTDRRTGIRPTAFHQFLFEKLYWKIYEAACLATASK
jgi:hypothetical protein